ncbi:hypothetical protein BJX96DRAFT_183256 [Aspergillus floccosus]
MASKSDSVPSPAPQAADASVSVTGAPAKNTPPARRQRSQRPNYRHIHRFPLPVSVHPLPPLIPHNPLSVVSVLLSYLTYFISPPSQEIYPAYFDRDTSSVHVTDAKAIRALWEMGFFGKGSLSRSEPNWLEQEKKRRGLLGGLTSEEVTRQRRSERRELKLERARMEKLAIEERLKAEAAAREAGDTSVDASSVSPSVGGTNGAAPTTEKYSLRKAREARQLESQRSVAQQGESEGTDSPGKKSPNGKTVRFSPVVQAKEFSSDSTSLLLPGSSVTGQKPPQEEALKNEEHLQLSNEEAFFLVYGLGALQIYDRKTNSPISSSSLLQLFCQHSYYPPRATVDLKTDDTFLVSYVVYHHFRSLGWVVRSGVKFGVDYLLYNRGPVFSHAEFAVVIIPSYDHPYWSETEDRKTYCASKQARSWWWFHCVNRVQAQVRKTLVVCYVEIPPIIANTDASSSDIGVLLGHYKTQEDSIDIGYLQRVALGLESAPSQPSLHGPGIIDHLHSDCAENDPQQQSLSTAFPSTSITHKNSLESPSSHPSASSRPQSLEQHANRVIDTNSPSFEQTKTDITPALRLSGKMSSAETGPSDTQVISQSVYDDLIRQNKETATSCLESNLGQQDTLATLHEGDTGHIDLLAAFDNANTDAGNPEDNENEDQSSQKLGESSPLHYQPNFFPESQRFLSKTPATAVKHTNIDSIAAKTPSTVSRNPLATDVDSSGIMALSQVFKATQAPSSPLVHGHNVDPLSDRPSPNLPIQGHPLATAMSSPLNNLAATFPQDSSEPHLNYITMKESQAQRDRILRERMTRSAENIYSEDQSDGEFEKEPSFVERVRRQRMINEEAAAQFAALSAPARPDNCRGRHSEATSSPKRPERRDWADGAGAAPEDEHQAPEVLHPGATSEEETEQEEDTYQPVSHSQEPNVSTEEDKENCDEHSATPIAAAADAHGRLSQVLSASGDPQSQVQGADRVETEEIAMSSQILVVKDSQLSPSQNKNEHEANVETSDRDQTPTIEDQDDPSATGLPKSPSPAEQLRLRSTPPSTSHRSRVSFQLQDEDRVMRPRSESASSHGSLQDLPGIQGAREGSVTFSSKPAAQRLTASDEKSSKLDGKEKPSSMPSRVAETPVRRHPRSSGDELPGTSIPETSPNRFQNPQWVNDLNEEDMDQEDDDLPPYPLDGRVHQHQPMVSHNSSPIKRLFNSKILSSPSGRQRRALTEIAADASPQVGHGPFDLDFNILSAEDREFNSAVAMSPIPPRKRRRRNDGPNVSASDPVLPVTPRSISHLPPLPDNEQLQVTQPQNDKTPVRPQSLFEKRPRLSKPRRSVWDVEDSPQFKRSHKRHVPRLSRPRSNEPTTQPKRPRGRPRLKPARSPAQPVIEVVIRSSQIESESEEPQSSAVQEEPTRDLGDDTPVRAVPFPDDGIQIAANQVLAPWTGMKRAYYPATCFGQPFGTQPSRYLVKFVDSAPVEVSVNSVKKLELRIGDAVKVDMPNVPKVTHIVRGFEDRLSPEDIAKGDSTGMAPMTDVYGYSTLVLGPKQPKSLPNGGVVGPESVVRVPISQIYMDTNMYNRLKDRDYTFNAPNGQSESRLETPSDRNTTPASPSTRLSRSIRYSSGLFAGMVFAVSYGENDDAKLRIVQMIQDNEGRVLHDGFNELFDLPLNAPQATPTKSPALGASGSNGHFRLSGGAEDVGFACLIADRHSRRPKYMQALALNLPCLSDRWVEDCVAQGRVVDWEMYLLPAGESSYLNGATKSRILPPYPANKARLPDTIAARPNLLQGQSVLIVMGRSKADEEKRKAYLFLTYALGAARVERVSDIKAVRATLEQQSRTGSARWDWIYVDNEEKASAISGLLGPGSQKAQPVHHPRKRKRGVLADSARGRDPGSGPNVRIVGNEFVCQSLILGKLVD